MIVTVCCFRSEAAEDDPVDELHPLLVAAVDEGGGAPGFTVPTFNIIGSIRIVH